MAKTAQVINIIEEKERILFARRITCPRCRIKNEYCPDWIASIQPGSEQHRNLSLRDKFEFLVHTTHLV